MPDTKISSTFIDGVQETTIVVTTTAQNDAHAAELRAASLAVNIANAPTPPAIVVPALADIQPSPSGRWIIRFESDASPAFKDPGMTFCGSQVEASSPDQVVSEIQKKADPRAAGVDSDAKWRLMDFGPIENYWFDQVTPQAIPRGWHPDYDPAHRDAFGQTPLVADKQPNPGF